MRPAWILALLLLTPAAMADFTVTAVDLAGPLAPETETGRMTVTATMDCPDAVLMAPPEVGPGITMTLNATAPSFVSLTGPKAQIASLDPCTEDPQGVVVAEFPLDVTLSRAAPGMLPIEGTVNVTAEGLDPPSSPVSSETPFTVEAAPFFILHIALDEKVAEVEDGEAVFHATVTNFGNVLTQVHADLSQAPLDLEDGVRLPEDIVLGSPNDDPPVAPVSAAVALTVQAPLDFGWNNEQRSLQVTWTPTAAEDPGYVGEPVTSTLLVKARGLGPSKGTPSVGPVILGGALVALALAARRH